VNTGNNLLYLIVSALLGFMSISGILGNQNLKNLAIYLEPPEEIYDGVETLLTVSIENNRRFMHSFLLEILFQKQCSAPIPILFKGARKKVNIPVTFNGRGDHLRHTLGIQSNFPINFFIRSRTITIEQTIVVFPKPLPCGSALSFFSQQQAGMKNESPQKGYEGDITRIGDYQGGEPLKMVHWKLSARHDTLKIKELSSTGAEPVEIDLHSLPGTSLDSRLSCASFLINEFTRSNRPVGLRLEESVFSAGTGRQHKYTLLTALARYAKDTKAP